MPPADDPARRLAEVAHELNTPLAAILAFTQDLLEGHPTLEQREALAVIQAQARRARQLVQSLLAESRGVAASRAMLDPRELVERVALVFERLARERDQILTWSAPGPLPPLEADAEALEQALGNLLRNAVQATPPGGALWLGCRQRGRLVQFEVRDSGPGIPAEHLAAIFDPYFTTKPAGEGTGLGLSVARAIVHRHCGALVAENLLEGGARFVMEIPFDRRARERNPQGRESRAESGEPKAGAVLLVEDDADLRRALARYLARQGWTVTEAANGTAAAAAIVGTGFDVVVSDARLPDTTGMALYERLAAEQRFVLISGNASDADITAFRERTGVVVLQKPFELEELGRLLAG